MKRPPAVIVHGLDQARTALAPGFPVTLLSAPGAGWHGGAGWWLALVAAAHEGFAAVRMEHVLDCADLAGAALAALRLGQPALVLSLTSPAFVAVAAIAAAQGATLLDTAPPALDLDAPGALRRLLPWLAAADVSGGDW